MGSLRGRTRDSSWQWLFIGLVLGIGCSGLACLAGYAFNLIAFNLTGQASGIAANANTTPTIVTLIITATPQPGGVQSTPQVVVVTATNAVPGTVVAVQPSATPAVGPVTAAANPTRRASRHALIDTDHRKLGAHRRGLADDCGRQHLPRRHPRCLAHACSGTGQPHHAGDYHRRLVQHGHHAL